MFFAFREADEKVLYTLLPVPSEALGSLLLCHQGRYGNKNAHPGPAYCQLSIGQLSPQV